jgi:hypothetical protein
MSDTVPNPPHGGSFLRDAETGALQLVERSLTVQEQEDLASPPAPPPAPEPDPE